MVRKILAALLYFVLFVVTTLVFTYFLFPIDQLREFLEHKANSSSKIRLSIEMMDREGVGTIVMEDIDLGIHKKLVSVRKTTEGSVAKSAAGGAPAGSEEADPFSTIHIDSLSLDFSPGQLLSDPRVLTLGLDMELLGGGIHAGLIEFDREQGFSRPGIRLPDIEELSLGDTELFATAFSAVLPSLRAQKVVGSLSSGLVELEPQEEEDSTWYEGTIELEFDDIVALQPVLENRVQKAGTVEIPLTDLKLGSCVFVLRVDRRDRLEELDKVKAKGAPGTTILFEKGECKGESLDYFVSQNSYIHFPQKEPMVKGNLDLWTRLAFSPDYFEESREENGTVVTRNKELGQGLDFDQLWQRSRDVDGYYWMHCKGSVAKPRCRRGLPPAEEARKSAQKRLEAEKKKKDKEKAASKVMSPAGKEAGDSETPVIGSTPRSGGVRDRDVPSTSPRNRPATLLDQRKERAQEESEKIRERLRKQRENQAASGAAQQEEESGESGEAETPEESEGMEGEYEGEGGEEYPEGDEGAVEEGEEPAEGHEGEYEEGTGGEEEEPGAVEGEEEPAHEEGEGEGEPAGEPEEEGELTPFP